MFNLATLVCWGITGFKTLVSTYLCSINDSSVFNKEYIVRTPQPMTTFLLADHDCCYFGELKTDRKGYRIGYRIE